MGVGACLAGVRKMLSLIWSKEQSVKDAVTDAYKRIYLNPRGTNPRYTDRFNNCPWLTVVLSSSSSSSSSIFDVNIITPTSRGDILRQLFHQCMYHMSQMPGGKDESSGQT